ncbi:M23 family metallopeptidase [Staphylococcus warneri]|uniref:M23 family metallopeptidase n=1 Tax=Staphylococcus warneri TaxID=1292 RepID=UPI0009C029A9
MEQLSNHAITMGGGNETQVYDGSKYTHIFMHQSKRGVSTGDKVHQGQIIGLTGNTGNSTGPLHWQVNKGKGFLNNHPDSINPLEWVKQAAKAGGKGVSIKLQVLG